jgi:hypothetical protein
MNQSKPNVSPHQAVLAARPPVPEFMRQAAIKTAAKKVSALLGSGHGSGAEFDQAMEALDLAIKLEPGLSKKKYPLPLWPPGVYVPGVEQQDGWQPFGNVPRPDDHLFWWQYATVNQQDGSANASAFDGSLYCSARLLSPQEAVTCESYVGILYKPAPRRMQISFAPNLTLTVGAENTLDIHDDRTTRIYSGDRQIMVTLVVGIWDLIPPYDQKPPKVEYIVGEEPRPFPLISLPGGAGFISGADNSPGVNTPFALQEFQFGGKDDNVPPALNCTINAIVQGGHSYVLGVGIQLSISAELLNDNGSAPLPPLQIHPSDSLQVFATCNATVPVMRIYEGPIYEM